MRPLALLIALALVAVAVATTGRTGATFTARKAAKPSVVASATDWSPPVVVLANPGSPLKGTVALSATATDRDGVASVAFERSPAGAGTWTVVATDASAPFTASLDTTALADGLYDLRAVARDNAGESARSTVSSRLVDNTAPAVAVTDPGAYLRGTVSVAMTASDGGSGLAAVRLQRAPAGATNWTDVCTDTVAPFACTVDTTTLATDLYDLRAIATDAAGNAQTSALVQDVQVDNVLPAVTMTDPGSPLSGTVTVAATAADADSGLARVVIQRAPAGATTWTDVCTDTATPYACRFDTTTVPDGLYDLRAVATDLAGNERISAAVTGRRVDNTVSTVSMEDPGQYLRGTVALTAAASSTAGVQQVTIQWSPAGKAQWATVCVDTTAPYSCSFNTATTATPDGLYDFRAVMVPATGATVTSATVAGRTIDNSLVRGHDVQAENVAGGTAGRMESGDRLRFWWTHALQPSTLVAGWTGAAAANVWVRIADNAADGNDDALTIWGNAGLSTATGFGSIAMKGNYVRANRSVSFASTVTLASAQVNGVAASVATITLGTPSTGGLRTWTGGGMTWTPSASATDLAGNKVSAVPVTETGALDRDF